MADGWAEGSPLAAMAEEVAAYMRGGPRLNAGWHLVLPQWALHGRTWEQFCEEFEASYLRRPDLAAMGVIGFEIDSGLSCLRYTLKRYRDEQEAAE